MAGEWCHYLTYSLCFDASVVAWIDDSTCVDSNFQTDRENKEPGQSRDCTKCLDCPGRFLIHTTTSGAWERPVLPWLYMLTLQSAQAWSKTNCGIRQNAVNKRILKGRQMNPNSNVKFEVPIFKLRLTSLVCNYYPIVCIYCGDGSVSGPTMTCYCHCLLSSSRLF